MSTGCALDENWMNIVVVNSPLFCLGNVRRVSHTYKLCLETHNLGNCKGKY